MSRMKIFVRTHHFMVTGLHESLMPFIREFTYKFIQWEMQRHRGQYTRTMMRVYAAANKNRTERRFHINSLDDFLKELAFKKIDDYDIIYQNSPKWVNAVIPIKDHIVPYDYQIPVIDYCCVTPPVGPRQKQIPMQTGKGKGVTSMKSMERLQRRTAVLVRPMYMEKWLDEFYEKAELSADRYLFVQGGDALAALTQMASDNKLDADVIIISNKTFQVYIKTYEEEGMEGLARRGYTCAPDEFFEHIGVGLRLIDEVHLDFHLNFKLDLYSNVDMSISLSGTLFNDTPFIQRMYDLAYPPAQRAPSIELDRYVDSFAIMYDMSPKTKSKVRFLDFNKRYNHILFEQSLMRSKEHINTYFNLLVRNLKEGFFEEGYYKKGDKALIFVDSIQAATLVTNRLKQIYPNMDVRRYVEDDPYENAIEGEIIVSTIKSAGTALDIPGLTVVIMTIAINSIQSNVQALGRLRALKDGRAPRFYYWVCRTIMKHMEYHERKKLMLIERAKSYRTVMTGVTL